MVYSLLDDLNEIIDDSTDYRRYTERQKQLVMMMCLPLRKY
jgi:hypothetical protein